eukprot:scaffold69853_cov36-Phaeocystis_antarctica.AAC.1
MRGEARKDLSLPKLADLSPSFRPGILLGLAGAGAVPPASRAAPSAAHFAARLPGLEPEPRRILLGLEGVGP